MTDEEQIIRPQDIKIEKPVVIKKARSGDGSPAYIDPEKPGNNEYAHVIEMQGGFEDGSVARESITTAIDRLTSGNIPANNWAGPELVSSMAAELEEINTRMQDGEYRTKMTKAAQLHEETHMSNEKRLKLSKSVREFYSHRTTYLMDIDGKYQDRVGEIKERIGNLRATRNMVSVYDEASATLAGLRDFGPGLSKSLDDFTISLCIDLVGGTGEDPDYDFLEVLEDDIKGLQAGNVLFSDSHLFSNFMIMSGDAELPLKIRDGEFDAKSLLEYMRTTFHAYWKNRPTSSNAINNNVSLARNIDLNLMAQADEYSKGIEKLGELLN